MKLFLILCFTFLTTSVVLAQTVLPTPAPPINCQGTANAAACNVYLNNRLYDLENRQRTNPIWFSSDSGKVISAFFVFGIGFVLGRSVVIV
jgi:hypothetical protein